MPFLPQELPSLTFIRRPRNCSVVSITVPPYVTVFIAPYSSILSSPPPPPPPSLSHTHPAVVEDLYNYMNPINKKHCPMVSKEVYDIVMRNAEVSITVKAAIRTSGELLCLPSSPSISTLPLSTTGTTSIASLASRYAFAPTTKKTVISLWFHICIHLCQTLERSYLLKINGKGTRVIARVLPMG